MTPNSYSISQFFCIECGNKFPLPRPNNKKRKRLHIKDLYCPFCKKVVKTVEFRDEDFYMTMSGDLLSYDR